MSPSGRSYQFGTMTSSSSSSSATRHDIPHRVMPSPAATPSSSRSGYWSTVLDTAPSRRYSDSIPPTPATPSSSSSQHLAPDPVAPLDKPYACDTCGTAFKKNSNLVKHIKLVHLGERNFACPEEGCGRLFGQKSNLNSHIKAVHLGEKPFKCSEIDCGRRFSQKSGLKAHTKTVHKGERPYICDDCDASFGHRGDVTQLISKQLNRHIRVLHEQQRPFQCPLCPEPRSFGRKSVLHRHMQTHEAGRSSETS